MSTPTASIAALLLGLAACTGALADPGALRLALSDRMGMVYTPRPPAPTAVAPHDLARAQPQASLGLEFASRARREGPRSLLRVQLSGDSTLAFRPRGGGLHVTYRSTF